LCKTSVVGRDAELPRTFLSGRAVFCIVHIETARLHLMRDWLVQTVQSSQLIPSITK
jgi:hypothetical protein